jgi:hypothetical protein
MNKTIYISIAACNEKDLYQTVLSAVSNATFPDRLYFGIVSHSFTRELQDLSDIDAKINCMYVSYPGPTGVGLPRLMASSLNNRSQDFYFQIDAHMIFENNWDVDLISSYEDIHQEFEKPIITTYGPWWYEDTAGCIKLSTHPHVSVNPYDFKGVDGVSTGGLKVGDFKANLFRRHLPVDGQQTDWRGLSKDYNEHLLTAGGFFFTSMSFVSEVLPDPQIVFGGEEPSTALRAWTRGYRFFNIKKPICWHKNKLGDIPDKDDWRTPSNSVDKGVFSLFTENDLTSLKRVKDIFLGNILGYWGAPTLSLLKEYEEALGVSFVEYYDQVTGL